MHLYGCVCMNCRYRCILLFPLVSTSCLSAYQLPLAHLLFWIKYIILAVALTLMRALSLLLFFFCFLMYVLTFCEFINSEHTDHYNSHLSMQKTIKITLYYDKPPIFSMQKLTRFSCTVSYFSLVTVNTFNSWSVSRIGYLI